MHIHPGPQQITTSVWRTEAKPSPSSNSPVSDATGKRAITNSCISLGHSRRNPRRARLARLLLIPTASHYKH